MAEFILKDMVKKAGLEDRFRIDSVAATREEIGNDMYPPAKRKLREKGIPFSPRAARLLVRADYDRFDYLIGMDEENLDDMVRICGGDPEKKISLLLEWAGISRDVADPWYTGNFEATYRDLITGCSALLESLLSKGSRI